MLSIVILIGCGVVYYYLWMVCELYSFNQQRPATDNTKLYKTSQLNTIYTRFLHIVLLSPTAVFNLLFEGFTHFTHVSTTSKLQRRLVLL